MRTTCKNGMFDSLQLTGAAMAVRLKLTFLSVVCICLYSMSPAQASTIARNWSLNGEREETFEMNDSGSFTVSFPDLVPPTHLFGYDRFGVTISDSMDSFSMDALPVLHFSFDAGFLYFNHVLTVTIPFSSPLIADSLGQPGRYRLYRDPFPYTGFHQWYADDSITIDTIQSLIRFVYHHPKYIPLQKARVHAAVKIASTGYPFLFGIFSHPSNGIGYGLRNSRTTDAGFNCRITEKKIIVTGKNSDDNRKNISYRMSLFDGRGRRIGQWRLPALPALLSLSNNASPGMYLAVLYQGHRRIAVCPGITPESGMVP
ncbi:MAG: hypothetical protein JW913_02830 [Chitinispirillaceae bacterium]|nr:hypothetical protein [Chitinispirillaceae bacterium]